MSIDLLTVSSKGQVVLPASMRNTLSIAPGSKIAAYMRDGAILLKPINLPSHNEFDTWMNHMQAYAAEINMSDEDINQAIADVRSGHHA